MSDGCTPDELRDMVVKAVAGMTAAADERDAAVARAERADMHRAMTEALLGELRRGEETWREQTAVDFTPESIVSVLNAFSGTLAERDAAVARAEQWRRAADRLADVLLRLANTPVIADPECYTIDEWRSDVQLIADVLAAHDALAAEQEAGT